MLLRNELKELRAVSHDIKESAESQMLRNKSVNSEIDIIIGSSQNLRKESENTRKKSQIIASSRNLREELRVIREESLRIIDRSRNLRKSDNDIKTDTDKVKKPDAHKDIKPDACKYIKPDKHMNTEEKEDSSE